MRGASPRTTTVGSRRSGIKKNRERRAAPRHAGADREVLAMGWLDGQVALVTGGGSGIGRAVVARYVAEGARVAVMDRVAGRGDEVKAEFGDKVTAVAG